MQAQLRSDQDVLIGSFVERVSAVRDDADARAAFRREFDRLRAHLGLYPAQLSRPSAVFESAATTMRSLAASCLPLAIAVSMHLYPLCALQCVPLCALSPARFKRAMLLRTIRQRSLIVANTGSERTRGHDAPLIARADGDGMRIEGTCDYMSLGSVADIVFFKAQLDDRSCVLCAADLGAASVRTGPWKFSGRMRLSDTASITFDSHRVPHGRYFVAQKGDGLQSIVDYQRCWFHLFLAEIYLARVERVHELFRLPRRIEHAVGLNEAARLRDYSLRLLDEPRAVERGLLMKATSTLKLGVSRLAQATADALGGLQGAEEDARELRCMKSQPTADERILRSFAPE